MKNNIETLDTEMRCLLHDLQTQKSHSVRIEKELEGKEIICEETKKKIEELEEKLLALR